MSSRCRRSGGAPRPGDVDDLAEALRRAATVHGGHEALTGEYDAEWPEYATYVVAEQSGAELPV